MRPFSTAIQSFAMTEMLLETQRTEQMAARLLAVVSVQSPGQWKLVQEEVSRRKAVIGRRSMMSMWSPPGSPLRMALESVYDDLVQGRLG